MARKRNNKKGQVWLSDYTLSMLLFILAALISVKIIINSFSTNTAFEELKSESFKIGDILLSEGYPVNWSSGNSSDVIRPGLLTGKRLNETKVIQAMNSTYINYTSLKTMLQTKHDFAVVFEEPNSGVVQFNGLCVIGNGSVLPTCASTIPTLNFKYHDLASLSRMAVYNSTIKRMVIYVWN
jgi:hypothetical protein